MRPLRRLVAWQNKCVFPAVVQTDKREIQTNIDSFQLICSRKQWTYCGAPFLTEDARLWGKKDMELF
jgi:hypothetical protein